MYYILYSYTWPSVQTDIPCLLITCSTSIFHGKSSLRRTLLQHTALHTFFAAWKNLTLTPSRVRKKKRMMERKSKYIAHGFYILTLPVTKPLSNEFRPQRDTMKDKKQESQKNVTKKGKTGKSQDSKATTSVWKRYMEIYLKNIIRTGFCESVTMITDEDRWSRLYGQ